LTYDTAFGNKGQLRKTINGVSPRFKELCKIYKIFAKDWAHLVTFTDEDIVELYNGESYGTPVSPTNGFLLGKKWSDVFIAMWREDIQLGLLRIWELEDTYPRWWLDKMLNNK